MALYTIRNPDGSEKEIDTGNGFTVRQPSRAGTVCELHTWGRPDHLSQAQAAELAEQDFRARQRRSCANCFFHGRREAIEDCDRLCCSLREVTREEGIEISPYVHKAPAPPPEGEEPGCCAIRMIVGWGGLFLFWRQNLTGLLLTVGALCVCAVILLLASGIQRKNQPREPRGRSVGDAK